MPHTKRLRSVAPVLAAVGFMLSSNAWAALGGPYSSVAVDRTHMAAKLAVASAVTHTVHTLTLANGGKVRELTRADGVVFAVTWRGPGRPDLRQLLGPHFNAMQTDNAAATGRHARRPLRVDRDTLVLRSGGHPGAFWGYALLPKMAPTGFSPDTLN